MCKANDYIDKIESIVNDFSMEWSILNKELSRLDLIQQDILHQIENTNFDAAKGYAFAKSLKVARIKRRKIKQDIEKLEEVSKITQSMSARVGVCKKVVDDIKTRQQVDQYHPRVLTAI